MMFFAARKISQKHVMSLHGYMFVPMNRRGDMKIRGLLVYFQMGGWGRVGKQVRNNATYGTMGQVKLILTHACWTQN